MGHFDYDPNDPKIAGMLKAFGSTKKKEPTRETPKIESYIEEYKPKIDTEDRRTIKFLAHIAKVFKTYERSIAVDDNGDFYICKYDEEKVDKLLGSTVNLGEKKSKYF